jgi:hypothetical protein
LGFKKGDFSIDLQIALKMLAIFSRLPQGIANGLLKILFELLFQKVFANERRLPVRVVVHFPLRLHCRHRHQLDVAGSFLPIADEMFVFVGCGPIL